MYTNQESTTFEFLLTLENNIIIQRYFDVRNYNPSTKNSMDIYYWVSNVCNEISSMMKIKNLEYMCDNYYLVTDNELVNNNTPIKEEYFKLELKQDNQIFISRIFPAHIYHPKARYCDIRPVVKRMISEITSILTSKNPEKKYLQYSFK